MTSRHTTAPLCCYPPLRVFYGPVRCADVSLVEWADTDTDVILQLCRTSTVGAVCVNRPPATHLSTHRPPVIGYPAPTRESYPAPTDRHRWSIVCPVGAVSSRPSDCRVGIFEVLIIFDISTNNAVYYSSQSSCHRLNRNINGPRESCSRHIS